MDTMVNEQRAELHRGRLAATGNALRSKVDRDQRRSPSAVPVPRSRPSMAMDTRVTEPEVVAPQSLTETIGLKPVPRPRRAMIRVSSPQELSEKVSALADSETGAEALFPDSRGGPTQRPRAAAADAGTDEDGDDPLDDDDSHDREREARRGGAVRATQKVRKEGSGVVCEAPAAVDRISPPGSAADSAADADDDGDVDASRFEEGVLDSRRQSSAIPTGGASESSAKAGKGKVADAKKVNEEQYFQLWRKRPSLPGL